MEKRPTTRIGFGRQAHTRGGLGRGQWRGRKESQESTVPLGDLVETVTHKSLGIQSEKVTDSASITKCQYLASFNWLKDKQPTVVIPGILNCCATLSRKLTTPVGVPPMWKPLDEPRKLPEDADEYFRDINAAHYPEHPIEPAVRAVLAQNPQLPTREIDIFACGSTLGNLLRFARSTDKSFRFVVETVGDTVFFSRRENSPDEKIIGVKGHGHTFPEAYTTLDPCVETSDSHQRIVRYDFAGFQCIVRNEVDGYLPSLTGGGMSGAKNATLPDLDGLKMLAGGAVVPQEAIFDLKTRAVWKKLTLDDVLQDEIHRLWLRQIPNFVLAYHDFGVFKDIGIHNVRSRMEGFEKDEATAVAIFAATIAKVVSHARMHPKERFEICSQRPGVLEIRHVGGKFANSLPNDLKSVWARKAPGDQESDDDDDFEAGIGSNAGIGSDAEGGSETGAGEDSDEDFTACSAFCGYCGRCT